MSLSTSSACLLLLLCPPLVSCGSLPSYLQEAREHRLGQTARKPKVDPGKVTLVLDVSDDVDHLPDATGEYTGAWLTKPGMPPDFTLCGAYLPRAWITSFTAADLFQLTCRDGKVWGQLHMYAAKTYTDYQLTLGDVWFSVKTPTVWFPLSWTRVCLSLDTKSGTVVLVINGVLEKVHQAALEDDKNRPGNLTITLGHRIDIWKLPADFTGQYSDLNIFSSPLPTSRMIALTQAGGEECGALGDFLSWEDADWRLTSRAKMVMLGQLEGPCNKESSMNVFTADFKRHSVATNKRIGSACIEHCQKLGKGRSPPVRTLQELKTLQTELQALSPNISDLPRMWLSATDQEEEGVWRDSYTGERLEQYSKPWMTGHDGDHGDQYNCLNMYTNQPANSYWHEWECFAHDRGCPCQYSHQPIILLRGLCPYSALKTVDEILGTKYTFKQMAQSPRDVFLVGGVTTQIHFNDSSQHWVMTDALSTVRAKSNAAKVSYVLGKHEWTVTNDALSCSKYASYTTLLKLSGCNPDGEFTCNDGQCVTMAQRCNQIPNCRDKSDEVDCRLLVLENNYNSKVPPIIPTGENDFNQTKVGISISLLKIVSMEEVQHKIDLQFEVTLEGKENRAAYNNLKVKTSLNALTNSEIAALWLPYVIYDNTDMKEAVQLMQGVKTTVVATREGTFSRTGVEFIDETEIFKGSENQLVMSQTYTKSFQCAYNLEKYPFDTQVSYFTLWSEKDPTYAVCNHRFFN